jgi:hypothetical protein
MSRLFSKRPVAADGDDAFDEDLAWIERIPKRDQLAARRRASQRSGEELIARQESVFHRTSRDHVAEQRRGGIPKREHKANPARMIATTGPAVIGMVLSGGGDGDSGVAIPHQTRQAAFCSEAFGAEASQARRHGNHPRNATLFILVLV